MSSVSFAFFGTPELAVTVLETLGTHGYEPGIVISSPDRPKGRGLSMTSPPAAQWAREHGIQLMQPASIDESVVEQLAQRSWDVFIVAAYGKLLPKSLLTIPARGVLNVHPSLLPKLRGASPVQSAVLTDARTTGVSIMLLDEKMDHGPVVAQKPVHIADWPPYANDLERDLAQAGANLLVSVLPDWIRGAAIATPQNDADATFCKKIAKQDGEIDLVSGDPHQNLLKIRGLAGWPGTYSFFERSGSRIRVAILAASIQNGSLTLETVKPEGKQAMPYADFARSGAVPITLDSK
jgi:methionyl-tRNA formyltransferase